MMVGNICNTSEKFPFEDWYVDPSVINPEIIDQFKSSEEYNLTSDKYLLS